MIRRRGAGIRPAWLAPLLLAGAGCAITPAAPVALADLPDCYSANYNRERALFTLNGAAGNASSQRCLLVVASVKNPAAPERFAAGNYFVDIANGGGGGAGGTLQAVNLSGGGGGGGGAGSRETRTRVALAAGRYVLIVGSGGPGGSACMQGPFAFGGGPGWAGSPSGIVNADTGDLVAGAPDAVTYVRPSRAKNDASSGESDGRGGAGPGQTTGGHGAYARSAGGAWVDATAGASRSGPAGINAGGDAGEIPPGDRHSGAGGGGGATSRAEGGDGGGEAPRRLDRPSERGQLGSGGGGGEGNTSACEPGAPGGNGYIALRPA